MKKEDFIRFPKQEEILTKAITKAFGEVRELRFNLYTISYFSDFDDEDALSVWPSKESLIFSHKFAKAFWGREPIGEGCNGDETPEWKMRLVEMILADDPIKYLENYV